MKRILFTLTIAGLALASCNTSLEVSKKRYSKGYYVELTKKSKKVAQQQTKATTSAKSEITKIEVTPTENLLVSTEEKVMAASENNIERKITEKSKEAVAPLSSEKSTKASKAEKKEVRQLIKKAIKAHKVAPAEHDIPLLLLVIIAILIPPIAVLIVDGFGGPFLLSILLWLLFYIPGLIYALWRIFR